MTTYPDCRSLFEYVMIKIWVRFLHESFRSISHLSADKMLGQLDLSTLSYDQMNKCYSFGHFAQAECRLLGLGQFLSQLGLVFLGRVSVPKLCHYVSSFISNWPCTN